METIIGLDEQIFYWINHDWSNIFFDHFFPFMRERDNWIPLYLGLIVFLIYRYKKYALTFILCAIVTAGVSDVVSSRVIKPGVERLRPCRQESMEVVLRARCGSGFSFTSSHAANHFAVATFFILTLGRVWRWTKPLWWLWALLISLGQVYVGVHFPFDILMGSILGIGIGLLGFNLYKKLYPIPELVGIVRD